MTKLPSSVANAAKLLDVELPGWANKIDVDSLDMREPNKCILGQLYNDYMIGIEKLDIDIDCTKETVFGGSLKMENLAENKKLIDKWIVEINKRINRVVNDVSLTKEELYTLYMSIVNTYPNMDEEWELKTKLLTMYNRG